MVRRRRHRRLAAAMAVVIASVGPSANADAFGNGAGGDVGWLADNHDHDWCWSTGWPASWQSDATNRQINLENQTLFSGGSNQSCNSGTDVKWQAAPISPHRGLHHCENKLSAYVCNRASATINTDTNVLPAGAQRRKTMCHELGHTTGAMHYSGSELDCMHSGTGTLLHYRSHLVNHMNALTKTDS